MSGAGSIRFDGSDREELVEVKDAVKSFTLKATLLRDLRKHAARQGKEPLLLIKFPEFTAEVRITLE
jgi:hypothetical protein